MSSTDRPLRIAVIAPPRFPIKQPYAGGLEAFCHILVRELGRQGHDVDLFAARGSDGHVGDMELPVVDWGEDAENSSDTGYPEGARERETEGFGELLDYLEAHDYDVVHNNTLHPAVFRPWSRLPLVTTLHTPALPEVQEAITAAGDAAGRFVAVSRATSEAWGLESVTIIPNGVDVTEWKFGPGGGRLGWFGRIVPEKGLHLAMDAARLVGMPLVIAGRRGDQRYFADEIAPRLDAMDATYLGEQNHAELNQLIGTCSVCLVTPRWDEPFGLVAIEAMACGTPVAAFARGGLASLLERSPSCVSHTEDPADLADAIRAAAAVDRRAVRAWVEREHSLEATARRYVELYREVAPS